MPIAWDFAIDVGGTFTDCLARGSDGATRRCKVLSSGAAKGRVGAGSTPGHVVDELRRGDPPGFWAGAAFWLLDAEGRTAETARVTAFDAEGGTLAIEPPLPGIVTGQAYELRAGFDAPVLAVRYLLGLAPDEAPPPVRLRLGTTRGTNALLTRTGARTALAVTRGFGDLLEIGYQDRPRLFELAIRKPAPLAERTIEIAERVAADGAVLVAPDEAAIAAQLRELRARGVESLAICLLHADLYPAHEELVERLARGCGFVEVSRSSAVAPLVKIVPRADTTVVDAYLNPVLREYVARLERELPGSEIRLMTSAGGLKRPGAFHGFESVLSGPAGGVVGFARVAAAAGRRRAIGFDMGGTSTDVARFDGRFEYEYETQKAGVRLVAPTLAIETVAAGGGSICAFDGVKLTVGPASAGADPGPACYGRGGPLCVTDLNLYLGRLAAERFPFAPDRAAVEARLHELCRAVKQATGEMRWPSQVAEDLLAIANSNMARAIRGITVARGFDPREYVLVAFGGAAGQHACAVARQLGIREILHDVEASLLSARGIALADVTRHAAAGIARRADDVTDAELLAACERLAAPLVDDVAADGVSRANIEVRASVDGRYVGVDTTLNVPLVAGSDWRREFETAHRRQFGYLHEGRALEAAAVRVEVMGRAAAGDFCELATTAPEGDAGTVAARRHVTVILGGDQRSMPAYEREALALGARVTGPALVVDDFTTVVVDEGWTAEVLASGQLWARDEGTTAKPQAAGVGAAAEREIFGNLLGGVAERMGHVLRRTAMSVNVKERLDYSCGVFTAAGELAACAAHIPVHLGAMGATVRAILAENPGMRPGDAFVTNNPYRGGSHLPDVTVVLPVYAEGGDGSGASEGAPPRLLFFTACRAHHAEIGGTRPGSMPPGARRLGEEGVVIDNFLLVRGGVAREAELRELLSDGPYPSRAVEENVADVRAQLAAVQQGAADLRELVTQHGRGRVERQLRALLEESELRVRGALARLPAGERRFVDYLETAEGASTPVAVTVTLHGDVAGGRPDPSADLGVTGFGGRASVGPAATFDFTGTGPVVDGNLNANPAIVGAAVLYVLRLLVDEEIPLNEGALRAVLIVLPVCLLNPSTATPLGDSPAVAAGNVETSQRVVDVLLGALGLAAASQGTMNNVLFGAAGFGFYETVCGGSGATADACGASAVQVHMTNTRTTDPEVLERRLPVRLWEFSVRRSSGGAGARRGGDGAVRKIEFRESLELSLVTQRRGPHPPFGLHGGAAGALGENLLHRKDGVTEQLPGITECWVAPGDVLELRTPGGGGFGASPRDVP